MINPAQIIFESSGNIGLTFCLFVVMLNIPVLWQSFPQKISDEIKRSKGNDIAKWRRWQNVLKINWILYPIIFCAFSMNIILVGGPATWVKLLSSFVGISLFFLFIGSIRVLENQQFGNGK